MPKYRPAGFFAYHVFAAIALSSVAAPSFAWNPTGLPVAITSNDSLDIRVAADSNGKMYTVWREKVNGANWYVWLASNASGAITPPERVSIAPGFWPVVAVTGSDV